MDVRNIGNSVQIALANNNGKVDKATVDELVSEAKTPDEKQAVADEFSRDAFDSNVDLSAVAKSLGVKSLDKPQVSGTLGTDSSGAAIFVSRDLSPKGGFDNAAQATAAARMSHQPNTAVVEKGGRFFAIETNLPPSSLAAKAKDAPELKSTGPKVDYTRYAELQKTAKEKGGKDNWTKLASYTYGVPEKQINVISDYDIEKNGGKMPAAAPPQINVYIGDKFSGGESGVTGPVGDARGKSVVNGVPQPASIVIEKSAFDGADPARANKVLFHEGIHLEHNDRLISLYSQYKDETKAKGKKAGSFETWIDNNKKLDPAEKKLMKQLHADQTTADTEALAHVESFVKAFNTWLPSKDSDTDKNTVGSDLLALPKSVDPEVANKAQQELFKFYSSQPPDVQAHMRTLLKSMNGVDGASWLFNQGPMKAVLAKA